ncbi:hypothetical protein JTE90_004453 [Oedothorax gibbosus]|uniref:Uncharacterized protein n=1 Tax=Oedothorax gibbosus TaxID=931172 RepID=A0AAV6UQH1_9ARAC|nr:hypothetical protein JTE90_004453 [Oedothorax gibbosus]
MRVRAAEATISKASEIRERFLAVKVWYPCFPLMHSFDLLKFVSCLSLLEGPCSDCPSASRSIHPSFWNRYQGQSGICHRAQWVFSSAMIYDSWSLSFPNLMDDFQILMLETIRSSLVYILQMRNRGGIAAGHSRQSMVFICMCFIVMRLVVIELPMLVDVLGY